MISKANYGLPEDPSIKAIKKKLEIKTEEANAPILKNNLVPTKYDLGKAPLAPDASEPNVEQINSEIRTNKPAFIKSNYEEKNKSDVIGNNEENDNSSEKDEKTKLEGESKDFVGAGLKALDFGVTIAQESEAKGRKERSAETINLIGKGASTGSAVGSVIPGVGTVIGGAVGAVGGLATGLIKSGKSKKLQAKKLKKERDDEFTKTKNSREQAQRLFDEQKQSNYQQSVLQAQQNILKAKY